MPAMETESALQAVESAIGRATERFVNSLTDHAPSARIRGIVDRNPPAIVARVLKSVEANYWQRELERRQEDPRFDWTAPGVVRSLAAFDPELCNAMVLTSGELSQIIERALDIQTEAILSPVKCMESNLFSRAETPPIKTVITAATRLGIEDRYLRALGAMLQGDPGAVLRQRAFQSIVRDVDSKKFNGKPDLVALASLSALLLVFGLRKEDEMGTAPTDLARAVMSLRGTPGGAEAVDTFAKGKARLPMEELEALFAEEGESIEGLTHEEHHDEEVGRFLEDLGIAADGAEQEMAGAGRSAGGVKIALTDEEKRAYVVKAVGRNSDLLEPIMRDIEGALTWEEVDRVIKERLPDQPDEMKDKRREFRSRIRG